MKSFKKYLSYLMTFIMSFSLISYINVKEANSIEYKTYENWKYIIKNDIVVLQEYINKDAEVIKIPDTIDSKEVDIYKGAFEGNDIFAECENLKSIVVDKNNKNLKDIDGVLMNKNETTIFRYPINKEEKNYIVPNTVTYLYFNSFKGCKNLENIKLNSVNELGNYVFKNCKSLVNIDSLENVKLIPFSAFEGCTSLEKINIKSAKQIFRSAFEGCSSLKEVLMSDKLKDIWAYAFEKCSSLEKIVLPNSIISVGEEAFKDCTSLSTIIAPDSLSEVDSGAFENCVSLENIKIPNSIKKLSSGIFFNCKKLKKVELPSSLNEIEVAAFKNCTELEEIVIPDSVIAIEDRVFENCSNLKKVKLPKLKSIEKETFMNCYKLNYINLSNELSKIGEAAFKNCLELNISIPQSVEFIESDAFYNCKKIEIVDFSSSSVQIDTSAFEECNNLKSVKLGNNVVLKGSAIFENCKNLEDVTLPNTLIDIKAFTFENCISLKKIIIPNTVKKINGLAFKGCENLEDILLPKQLVELKESVFEGCSNLKSIEMPSSITKIGNEVFKNCTSLSKIVIPNGVIEIGNGAFEGCSNLKSIELSNSITKISAKVFNNCISLSKIVIPNGVTQIGYSAFSGCSNLKSIEIPNSIMAIGSSAFAGCSKINTLIIPRNVTYIYSDSFKNCPNLTLKVYKNSYAESYVKENAIPYEVMTSLKVTPGPHYLTFNQEKPIIATIYSGDMITEEQDSVTWSSSNPEVAEVIPLSTSGVLTAKIIGKNVGEAEIKASLPNGFFDTCKVYVSIGKQADDNTIVSQELSNKISCEIGTEFSSLPLPKELKVKTKGGKEYKLGVQWNNGNYNKNKVGNYTIKGKFNLVDNLNNNCLLEPLIIVSVTDSYGVSLNNSNNNGSNIDINKPSSDNATKITDLKNTNLSSGNYKLEGNINYKGNLKIGAELTIPKGSSLNVSGNVTLKKGGKINVEGTLNCSNLDLNESNMWVDGALNAKNITINGALFGEIARLYANGSINASGNMNIKSSSTLHMNKGSKMVIYGDFNSGGYCHLNGGDLWVGGNFIHNGDKDGFEVEKGHNVIIFGEGTGWLNKTHKIKFNSKEAKIYNLYVEEDRLNSISGEYMDNVQGEAYLVNVDTSNFTFSKKKKISSFNKNKQELYKQFEKASLYTDQYIFNDSELTNILTKESIEDLKKMMIVWDALSSSDIMKNELGSYYVSYKQKCRVKVKKKDGKYVNLVITVNKVGSSGMFTSDSNWEIPSLNKKGLLTVSVKVDLNQFGNAINEYLKKELIGEFVGNSVDTKLEKMLGDLLNEGLKDMCSELTGMVFDVIYGDLTSKSVSLDSIEEIDNGSVNTKEISNSLFNDSNLEKAIRENLGLFNNEELTKEQLKNIISLDLSSKDISDLSGIENLSSLTSLSLNNNFIEDLSPISELTNLQFLDLGDNAISSIKDISNLTKLTYLDISNNFIEDISGISNMKNLTILDLSNNNIESIEALKNLTKITNLNISNNEIVSEDLGEIENLKSLEVFYAENCNLYDISKITSKNLKDINLSNNYIDEISSLNNNKDLISINLSNNNIKDISSLSASSNLKNLNVGENIVNNNGASVVKNFNKLENLNISNGSITSIDTLKNLTMLKGINLDGNKILDLSPLNNKQKLEVLSLSDCNINNNQLKSINSLNNLKEIDISNNNITSIESLNNSKNIVYLDVSENEIKDISSLSQFNKLEDLDISNNPIENNKNNQDVINNMTNNGVEVSNKKDVISVEEITLDKSEIEISVGEKTILNKDITPYSVSNKNVTWKSSNPSVVSVDKEGNITGISKGQAIITVTTEEGNKKAECKVIVKGGETLLGDMDDNGKINSFDALKILQISSRGNITEEEKKVADINKDGKVNSLDALKVLQYATGKIDKLE